MISHSCAQPSTWHGAYTCKVVSMKALLMKAICGVLAAALVLISTLAAQSAEYRAFDAERGWNATLPSVATEI
jgi:hypothetical protein